MAEFLKKAGVGFYLSAAACLLALVGFIVFIVTNGTAGYEIPNGTLGIVLGVASVAATAAAAYTHAHSGAQSPVTVALKLIALACIMGTLGILIADRAGLASAIFTYDSGNAVGWGVFYTSVVSMVFLLLSVILLIVTGFMEGKNKD